MEAITIQNLSFAYPNAEEKALKNINITINNGEFITLFGSSGSGKTTLLRLLKPVLSPHGDREGSVELFGKDIYTLSLEEQSSKIGFVAQNPDSQIVTDKVWHELAFGLESLGLDNGTIRRRVAETASYFGIEKNFEAETSKLSGGQKQILCLASVMVMQPQILILDEPASMLDPVAASEFLSLVKRINNELGITVIITEHRLEEVLPYSDRVVTLEHGEVISFDTPENTGYNLKNNREIYQNLPASMRIWREVSGEGKCPVNISQGRDFLANYSKTHKLNKLYPEDKNLSDDSAIELKNLRFRYSKDGSDVIKDLSLSVKKGSFYAIVGGNGAGKSTLLTLINGVNRPYSGKVTVNARNTAYLPQNPALILTGKTVLKSLYDTFVGSEIDKDEQNKLVGRAVSALGLESLINRHPFDLSGGEVQRAAIAKLLLLNPQILLLDEPTKGLDARNKIKFAKIIKSLKSSGVTVVMVTHDIEFCAKYADICSMLFNGEITSTGTPREFFSENSFYVTSSSKISRGIIDNAVTAEEVIYCCTGKREEDKPDNDNRLFKAENEPVIKEKSKPKMPLYKKITAVIGALHLIFGILFNVDALGFIRPKDFNFFVNFLFIAVPSVILMFSFSSLTKAKDRAGERKDSKLPKRTIAAAVMILLLIPLTIFIGTTYLDDQKYLFISLLVLFECMVPFFLVFEGRKPQARELVIIAVLCAIAIAGRTLFIALPQVKPVLAIVIISGVAFGGETGFMVGAVTMLVSNFYFGQGAWTPWQMFAAGIIGFLAGVLFKKGLLYQSRGVLCVFGFIVTVVIYGGIMNFSTLILTRTPVNFQTVTAYMLQGLPFDIIHGFSTLAVLFFLAEPMLEKLERVKTKYGV